MCWRCWRSSACQLRGRCSSRPAQCGPGGWRKNSAWTRRQGDLGSRRKLNDYWPEDADLPDGEWSTSAQWVEEQGPEEYVEIDEEEGAGE